MSLLKPDEPLVAEMLFEVPFKNWIYIGGKSEASAIMRLGGSFTLVEQDHSWAQDDDRMSELWWIKPSGTEIQFKLYAYDIRKLNLVWRP